MITSTQPRKSTTESESSSQSTRKSTLTSPRHHRRRTAARGSLLWTLIVVPPVACGGGSEESNTIKDPQGCRVITLTDDEGTGTETAASTSTSSSGDTDSDSDSDSSAPPCGVPFGINIASDPDTVDVCGEPTEFWAMRQDSDFVERCADETCETCGPDGYNVDLLLSPSIPTGECLRIIHETELVGDACYTRGLLIWRDDGSPHAIVSVERIDPPAALLSAGDDLEVVASSPKICSCDPDETWCCEGEISSYALEFTADGEPPISVRQGLVNFGCLAYADNLYEVVVMRAFAADTCKQPLTVAWSLRAVESCPL